MAKQKGNRMIANNKKAYHDYFIEDKYEAGISLAGTEVKSLRYGKMQLSRSPSSALSVMRYSSTACTSVRTRRANIFNKRTPTCASGNSLLHDYEIRKLEVQIKEKGYTLVPLQVLF